VAFYLNPINRTTPLSDYHNQRIMDFFKRCAQSDEEAFEMHMHFSLWRQQLTPFEKGAFCWKFEEKGAREFWISAINQSKALGILANRLFSAPANSVPSERSFSTQNYLHSKTRNRLKPDEVDKLIYIYMNSRVFRKNDGTKDTLTVSTLEEEELLEEEFRMDEDDEDDENN